MKWRVTCVTETLRLGVAALLLSALTGSPALSDDYPSRPVKVIVPFGAGGPTDVFTRAMADELQKSLKEPFVMENRPGAGTTIGTDFVAKAAPDGYTILMVSGTQTVNETLYPAKSYRLMRDLVPVAPLIDTDLVLVVYPSVPAKTLPELIALMKAKPGTINYGSSGPGSNYHMAGELLKTLAGVDIVHVPYKGSTGARNDIIGGQVQMLFDSVPTMAETLPGFQATLWVGVMAPKGTPPEIIAKLNHEITALQNKPEIKAAWETLGAPPLSMPPDKFGAFMQAQIDKWAEVIRKNSIKAFN